MKKFLVAILAIVYLGVSSGVAMTIHYCMSKVSSIDLLAHSDKCGKCGMKTGGGGCCKDEFKIFKLKDSHTLTSNEINIFSPVAVIDNTGYISSSELYASAANSDHNNHSPPVSQDISLCILNCVFRL